MARVAGVTMPPDVPGTVHCAACLVGYEPTPEQALVLAGLGPIAGWQRVAARYATESGWYLRLDRLLLCVEHRDQADHGDRPPPLTPPTA